MGFVVEPKEARTEPCKCYKYDTELLCFSDGIMGALSDAQEKKYCKEKMIRKTTKEQMGQVTKFKKWGKIANICFEEEVENTWDCIIKQAKKIKKGGSIYGCK